MNPSPSEIVELFSFVEVTLIQYATVAGHFPGVTASSVKPKPKKANQAEVTPEEPPKEETQANATMPTPKPKAKGISDQPCQSRSQTAGRGKGGSTGKCGKSESRPEKRKQQCIPFLRGTCQKGDKCRYGHQVDNDGRPVPVGPEILQKFDEVVKRFVVNASKAQAKAKAAPRGSMIVLEPEAAGTGAVACAARAPDGDKYYAMVDSGTNAIIVPLHPNMKGEIAECQVPSATVTGPIVQIYEKWGNKLQQRDW